MTLLVSIFCVFVVTLFVFMISCFHAFWFQAFLFHCFHASCFHYFLICFLRFIFAFLRFYVSDFVVFVRLLRYNVLPRLVIKGQKEDVTFDIRLLGTGGARVSKREGW